MDQNQLSYRNSVIKYYCFGKGDRMVLCFHGYGESALHFSFLEQHLGDQFRFISIDLPFHGATQWNEGLDFSIRDLCEIVGQLLPERNRPVILLGFSLGGRLALKLFQSSFLSVSKLVLLAPDGLKVNFWYWLATQTYLGNRLFAMTMKKPKWFFWFLKLLNSTGVVNTSVFKFVNYYIGDDAARDLLYLRWTGLRKIKPDLRVVKQLIREKKTNVRLIYGKYDRIILPVRGEKFRSGIEAFCKIEIIHAGHQVLHEKHVPEIIDALQTDVETKRG